MVCLHVLFLLLRFRFTHIAEDDVIYSIFYECGYTVPKLMYTTQSVKVENSDLKFEYEIINEHSDSYRLSCLSEIFTDSFNENVNKDALKNENKRPTILRLSNNTLTLAQRENFLAKQCALTEFISENGLRHVFIDLKQSKLNIVGCIDLLNHSTRSTSSFKADYHNGDPDILMVPFLLCRSELNTNILNCLKLNHKYSKYIQDYEDFYVLTYLKGNVSNICENTKKEISIRILPPLFFVSVIFIAIMAGFSAYYYKKLT